MNLKTKVKSYSFWVSLASAIILILKLVGQKFGFSVDEGLISDLFTSLCAILVIMGIIVVPSPTSIENKAVEQLKVKPIQEADQKVEEVVEVKNVDEGGNACVTTELQEEKQEEIKAIEVECINESQSDLKTEIVDEKNSDEKTEDDFKPETIEVVSTDLPNSSFSLESFIDRVCTKRNELDNNVMNFVEFLQREIDNIKK